MMTSYAGSHQGIWSNGSISAILGKFLEHYSNRTVIELLGNSITN